MFAPASRWLVGPHSDTQLVMDLLEEKGFIPEEFIETETKWFYTSLGIDGLYPARSTYSSSR